MMNLGYSKANSERKTSKAYFTPIPTMKSSTVLVVLGVASGAVAVRCNQGLTYCGSSLLKKGTSCYSYDY